MSKYKPLLFSNDISEGIFLFEQLGRTVFHPKQWQPGHRDDIIRFKQGKHGKEFSTFKINPTVTGTLLPTLRVILAQFGDCFASEGIKRVILGYEFCIDTGDATPVYCKKPHYGSNESSIIMK